MYLFGESDEGGVAGDTGSATHVAVAEMHQGKGEAACIQVMRDKIQKYPLADLADAASMFLNYAKDPRNRDAEVILTETPIAFEIAPAPEDETQSPISVIGTLDQIRRNRDKNRFELWDVKTSKKDPYTVLQSSTFQLAAYCIGASILLGKPVHPGGIITPRKYGVDVARSPVFWHCAWNFGDIEQILKGMRHIVARIRAGNIWHVPTEDCRWCPMRTPDACLPKLVEVSSYLVELRAWEQSQETADAERTAAEPQTFSSEKI